MNRNRTIALITVASLLVAGAAFATLPATADGADEQTTGPYTFDVNITQTFPGVRGIVTVTDGADEPVALTAISVTSTYDAADALPGGSSSGWTGGAGAFPFSFGISAGSLPGDHTLTIVVGEGDDAVVGTASYTV